MVNILLVIFKEKDLIKVHYKNNITNKEIWLFLWHAKLDKVNPKRFRQYIYTHNNYPHFQTVDIASNLQKQVNIYKEKHYNITYINPET